MGQRSTLQRYRGAALACVFACGVAVGQGWLSEACAATIYSYVDDKGNPVYTDKLDTIPEKYRAKVKVHELSDSDSKGSSMLQSLQQSIKNRVKAIGSTASSGMSGMDVRDMEQEKIITYAGAAGVFLLAIMYFSKDSPMIRLLALGLLIVLGLGTPVLLYSSKGGALDIMREKATSTSQAQQDRLRPVQP